MSKRLLELARVRTETIEVAGEQVTVREPSALEHLEYRERRNKDMADGIAYLIAQCVINADGTPVYALEEAQVIARGREQVWTPIVTTITGFIRREKKVDSPPPSDSTTA